MTPVSKRAGTALRSRIARLWLSGIVLVAIGLVLDVGIPGSALAESSNPHGDLSIDCAVCHTATSWTVADRVEEFDHDAIAQYPLADAHASIPCRSCHADPVFANVGTSCSHCHDDVHSGDLGIQCSRCHSPSTWNAMDPAISEHAKTEFPLFGAHIHAPCESCHPSALAGAFRDASLECSGCHIEAFFQTTDPDHVLAGFSEDCTSCHGDGAVAWQPASFSHPSTFPLEAGHALAACADCHQTSFKDTSTDCIDCHASEYEGAEPSHRAFPVDCTGCHQLSAWEPADFDHETFPLTRGHEGVECVSCHSTGYESTPTECVDCHLADSQSAEPDHDGFPDDCLTCHTLAEWTPAGFDHPSTFPLTQGHDGVDCASCHSAGYESTPTECVDCHLADSQSAEPSHDGFPDDCLTCHTLSEWTPAEFDHPSSFPLTQGHDGVDCASCHSAGYEGTPTECVDCHLADSRSAEPSHDGFPDDCLTCHTLSEWTPADFDHPSTFPLTQGHDGVDCASCHSAGYENTPTECIDCHLADFQGADPSHDGFPEECLTCHTLSEWTPAEFEHPPSFPLTGGHDDLTCASCHSSGYESTPTECVDCHLADSESATPSHDGLPSDCTSCHSLVAWIPSNFDHPSTFPLTQGHEGTDCASCHSAGYESTPTECVDCHLADSQSAEPSHDGFPDDCLMCHTLSEWAPAEFDHPSSFPLTQGHDDLACASCHSAGYETTPTECVDCHLADSQSAIPSHDGLPGDCTSCHSLVAWIPSNFDHPPSFPLTQGHDGVVCASCHSSGYETTPTECVDCHLADAQSAEPSHDGFPEDCLTCHRLSEWTPAEFDHPSTFPLTQGHDGVACASCHSSGYETTPTECVDCHLADSQSANPSHDGLPSDCTSCHSLVAWIPSSFDHPSTFPLTQGHDGVACASCHSSGYEGSPTECVDCHLADAQSAEPSHDGFPEDCLTCHTLSEWTPAEFDHPSSFPLTQGHDDLACASCHSAGYENTPTDCVDCHLADSQTATPSHDGLPSDCTSCHSLVAWIPSNFDHPSTFPLSEGHGGVDCASCHSAGYESTPTECIDCHLADFQGADPSHAGFSEDCTTCHTLSEWTPAEFDHPPSFPLTGGHDDLACGSCHSAGYENTPTDCVDCHLADSQTADPSHDGFPDDCLACHTLSEWTPAEFDHPSSFPLTGGHDDLACASCHSSGYEGTSTDCVDCHLADSQSAIPSHDGLPSDCTSCHSLVTWIPSNFDHPSTFPLTQGHDGVDCASCHTAGYESTPTECIDCHLADFQSADPSHDGFPDDCTTCHTLSEWTPAEFDHPPSFPLTGGHDDLACGSCHSAGYENTPTDCVDCHLADSQSATPSHDGLPSDCTSCHSLVAWIPSNFYHPSTFPLTQGHDGVDCASCHSAGYESTPTECIDCHLADFQGADPSHDGFPEDCTTCHTLSEWTPAEFDHPPSFPLTGGHGDLLCATCHSAGYEGTPTDCIECHLASYMNAVPDHVGGGFPEDCTACHTIQGWTPADFEHPPTFPLVLGHSGLPCADCHSAGYENTPGECIECHLTDFQTASPDHDGAGFPEDCTSCHTLAAWEPSTFNHDSQFFPIYSGKHREEWNSCTDCHSNPSDFGDFTCLSCHEHNQSRMNDKHDEVNGYSYDSDACLSCHPRGDD